MPYEHILTLIDDYLERLKTVRALLTAPETPVSGLRKKRTLLSVEPISPTFVAFAVPSIVDRTETSVLPEVHQEEAGPKISESSNAPDLVSQTLLEDEEPTSKGNGTKQGRSRQALNFLEIAQPRASSAPPRHIGPRATGTRRAHAPRAMLGNSETIGPALGGLVPSRPVFIPVEQLKLERVHKSRAENQKPASSLQVEEESLTAEMLTQRWTSVTRLA